MDSDTLLSLLKELNQDHIISKYSESSAEEQGAFLSQINHIETTYPGGLREYISRAKVLLENSKNNVNPYNDYTPSVPEGFNVKVGNEDFFSLEKVGFDELKDACFVLVAGGLGERLGYSDIKIGIETDLLTKRKFIRIYADYLLAYETRLRKKFSLADDWFIPLCIMTSGDTHDKTVALLEANNNFGLKKEQIQIVKQEKCPALLDNDCHLALKDDKLLLETKPHGHGDVHTLLYQHGVIERWASMNKKWLVLFQDTNVLIFNVIPSALGVSKKLSLAINSICVPRKPGEALGGICKLENTANNTSITINVEYNQLDPLLKAKYNPKGDVGNAEGISDFPGNTNVLLFRIEEYYEALKKTKGLMPEFVNPKYADETKTKFKSPTRLECMMQDFPKLLTNNEKVGFSMYEKWFCFSTCKNNLKDACDKLTKGLQPEAAFSIEQDMFKCNIQLLKLLSKIEVESTEEETDLLIEGQHIRFGPRVLIYPAFAATMSELKEKVKGTIKLTTNSTLIMKGDNVIEGNVYVDGYMEVTEDVKEDVKCENKKKMQYVLLKENEGEIYEKIRGYTLKEEQQ